MTDDVVRLVETHTLLRVYSYNDERKQACTCQLSQLDPDKFEEGKVPVDLPELDEDCPHRNPYYPPK